MLKYIELDGKVPKHDFNTFSTDHTNYKDAGIILNNKVVVVDFDDYTDVGNKLFNMYPTLKVYTSRGFHLWYKKTKTDSIKTPIRNYTNKLTVSGAKVDFKTNKKSHATIKQNGKMRKMENDHYLDDLESLPELPLLLFPSKLKHDIYGLKEHQGRNSALYNHLLSTLEQYDLEDETLNNLADFINNNVFAEPMKETEINNTIDSVKKKKPSSPSKQKYLDPKDIIMTSEVLVNKLDIHYFRGKLFFKQIDHYISDDNLLLRAIDQLIQLKPSQHKQLLDLFKVKANLQDNDDLPVQFNNGYCLFDNDIVEIEPGFTPYYLNIRYDDQAYDKHVDDFLDFLTCDRKDLRLVIEEVFAHILMTKNFPHKAFFFYGESASNGKSTFIKMAQNFTEGLLTSVSLEKFDDDTSVYSLIGKLLNVADDINASYLDKSSNFKTLASGDPILVRPIYSPPVTINNKATLIFTCNEMPTFKDKSGGISRRMVVIPCDNQVKEKDRDFSIDEKLSTDNAKSYLLKLAIDGIKRIKMNSGLSKSETIEKTTKEYFISSDSVLAFLENYDIIGRETKSVYRQYVAYCEDSNLKAVGSTEFGRRTKKAGFKSDQQWSKEKKKNERVYIKNQ